MPVVRLPRDAVLTKIGQVAIHWHAGLSVGEIAKAINSTPGSVGVMLSKLRKRGVIPKKGTPRSITLVARIEGQVVDVIRLAAVRRGTQTDDIIDRLFKALDDANLLENLLDDDTDA